MSTPIAINFKVDWLTNLKICCGLGLRPFVGGDDLNKYLSINLTFTDPENSISYMKHAKCKINVNSCDADNVLEKGTSFWTSLTRKGCAGKFKSCFHHSEPNHTLKNRFFLESYCK